MHDLHVRLKDGRELVGPLWHINLQEKWFVLGGDNTDNQIQIDDCESVVHPNLRTSPEQSGQVDMIEVWRKKRIEEDYSKAAKIAREAHEGQVRKIGGEPYFTHPRRVAKSLSEEGDVVMTAAFLHDVLEDTKVTEEDLRAQFTDEVVDAVVAVTRLPGETYMDFVRRSMKNEMGRKIKIADIKDNMRDLPEDHGLRKR
jgi:hypothetical protein